MDGLFSRAGKRTAPAAGSRGANEQMYGSGTWVAAGSGGYYEQIWQVDKHRSYSASRFSGRVALYALQCFKIHLLMQR
jgi:hypothetical protein